MELNPTIFLIDDDSDDQEIFSIAINDTNKPAKCVFADDGVHALEKINRDKDFIPDIIFIDMNMPRMNGQQCLAEIKKIDRLRHIPVYMYSTSADPDTIEENKRLGATDFIIKPPDIKALTNILSTILQKQLFTIMFCMCLLFTISGKAQTTSTKDTLPAVKELKKLSVEQLMDIVVTSVSRSPEKLSEVASAIQVITSDDIHRSSVTRLPEALRLATNMQVAQSGSHDWGITARGFNGVPVASSSLSNKLLVLIDGRTVYNPLFGGVYWDVQNILLEDLDRIEVISGPGGALWGANSVNGIVNIISKNAKETQGTYATAATGSLLKDFAAVRFGSHVDTTLYYRAYVQRFDYTNTTLPGNIDALDSWNMTQGGFRMDYSRSPKNKYTLQGDLYGGSEDDTASTLVNGQNVIGRWTHGFSSTSELIAQTYFDHTYRNIQRSKLSDDISRIDLDIQYSLQLGKANHFVVGVATRLTNEVINSAANTFKSPDKTFHSYNAFVQDQITLVPEKVELTLGTKILHSVYTGFEFHPTARVAWTLTTDQTIWAAVSKGVRTPTRFDVDIQSGGLGSFGNFVSEKVTAYELGYRVKALEQLSISVASYYNMYTDLRSIDTNYFAPPTYYFANNQKANTYGLELSANFIATEWWRLRGGITFLRESFSTTSPNAIPASRLIEAIDPTNQVLIQSIMDVTDKLQVDGVIRYVDALPTGTNGKAVPGYATFDLRIAYSIKWLTISVAGQNLAEENHIEFGTHEIPRRVTGKITARF